MRSLCSRVPYLIGTLVASIWAVGLPLGAQQTLDVLLAAPLTGSPEAVLTTADTFVVTHGDRISLLRGLPLNPVASEVTLSGPATPASPLSVVGPSTALYRAAGPDGIPGTSDDVLAVVRDLLTAPQVEVTSVLVDVSVQTFVGASSAVAVVLDAALQRILVVHHDQNPALIDILAAPVPLSEAGSCGLGRVDDDTVLAASPGSDLNLGTADDRLLTLTGLATGSYQFQDQPMPGAPQAGFFVTPSGVGVAWAETSPTSVELFLIREGVAGANVLLVPVTVPVNPSPAFQAPCSVRAGFGDSVLVRCDDDAGRGTGNVLVTRLSGNPTVHPGWYDNRNIGQDSALVGETEYVQFALAGPTSFQHYDVRNVPAVPTIIPFTFDSAPGFARLTSRSLVAVSTASGGGTAAVAVSDLPGFPAITSLSGSGDWAEVTPAGHTVVRGLSRGLAAGLVAHGGSIDTLRLITVPVVERIGAGKSSGPAECDLVITPTVPNPTSPVTLTMTPFTPNPGALWVLVTRQSAASVLELGSAQAFAPGSLLHLSLNGLVVTEPIPAPLAGISLPLDPIPVASQILGQEYHVQAVVYDASGYYAFSDAFLVVPN